MQLNLILADSLTATLTLLTKSAFNSIKNSIKNYFKVFHEIFGGRCSGSVVVTAYDFESGCPGSNPEWGPDALITAQGLPEPSSLQGSTSYQSS